jgi:hypothetical protein
VPCSGALVAGELKHRKGCDWKGERSPMGNITPMGRGEKGKRYPPDTKQEKPLAPLISSGHPSGFACTGADGFRVWRVGVHVPSGAGSGGT